ncbi:MAG: hypothetical protein V4671_11610 [Armatimonadota bacterium]
MTGTAGVATVTDITIITVGAVLTALSEDECRKKLESYGNRVRKMCARIADAESAHAEIAPLSFEITTVQPMNSVQWSTAIRFTVEMTTGGKLDPGWIVDAFEEQLGRGERVLYACDQSTLRLGEVE